MASGAVGRKTTSSHSYSSTSAGNLDNNLDALLDDLQTSVKTPKNANGGTAHHGARQERIIETKTTRHSPLRSVSPSGRTTTIEKFVSTGPAGSASGIPGLEMLDKELQDVQPGQSKTVAYKQVSYHYDRQQEGQNLEPWVKTSKITKNDASIVDDFCERTFEKSSSSSARATRDSPDFARNDKEIVQPGQSKTVAYKQVSYHYDRQQEGQNLEPWVKTSKITKNDASIVDDFCERTFEKSSSSSARATRDSPDFARNDKEIIYKADVSTKNIVAPTTTTTSTSKERDFKYLKETSSYTEPSPISSRKNIKTVRSDETEELTNVEYIPSSSSPIPASLAPGPNTKVTKTVKTYTYELPGAPENYTTTSSSSLTRNINLDKSSSYVSLPRDTAEKSISYHVEEQRAAYVPPSPSTNRVHREEKVYVDRRIYRAASPPPPLQTTSTVSRSERYNLQQSVPDYPATSTSSMSRSEQRLMYEHQQPAPAPESHQRTTVKQYEEHYSGSRPPQPRPYYPETTSSHHASTTVYKYDEQQSVLPTRPFPTSERPASPCQQPPKRIEDLMASFSDSEEVMEVRKTMTKGSTTKKEVDFVPHTPPIVRSKNVAGPPVYYPPGAGEFARKGEAMAATGGGEYSRKEESMAAMSKSSGGWSKERGAWEYGSSSKSEEKTKTKKAVVPVCLPLCCALPCVIM
ncbi:flocculation protein FLO11 [Copidosoma floridanum]|uniref:flocculation protein FLO11 n=1 Tax=Copidosoma floridanum TaxID=29053 RepID=UPI0006C95D58|nr:flocculation protein FLO11 [Copidosoma floridanum]